MDIVTHLIVGAVLAEGVIQWRRYRGKPLAEPLASVLWGVALVASVLPDLDWALAPLLTGGKLGNFLHRQGYLHSLFGVFLLTAVGTGICYRWVRVCRGLDRDGWVWFVGMALVSGWVHVGLDALTMRGVHPFWPFSDAWVFGDTFYQVEPWLWICLLPPLFLHRERARVRVCFAALFAIALTGIWFSGRVPWYASLAMTLVGVGLWRGIRPLSNASRLFLCSGLGVFVGIFFFSLSVDLKERVRSSHWLEKGNLELQDVMVASMPGNPLCWWIVAVEGDATNYRMKSGVIAAFPGLLPATECPLLGATTPTVTLQPVLNARPEAILWAGQYRETRERLSSWIGSHCGLAGYFVGARALYVQEEAGDLFVGDLRFDRQPGHGFGELTLSQPPRRCPRGIPNWPAPRQEITL